MEVKVEARLSKKEMFNFLVRHNYLRFSGICIIVLGIGALLMLLFNLNNKEMSQSYKFALLFISLLFIVVEPIMLYTKAGKQVKKNDSVNKPLTYVFSESGFSISRDEESVEHKYEDVMKVVSTKLSVLIYMSPYTAFIIPKKNIGDNFENFKKLITDNVRNARAVTVK